LPFEPQGWLRVFRNELQAALRSMVPGPEHALLASYWAPDDGLVDLENVLLYNVGQGCFSHLLDGGLYCRRLVSGDARHHVTL
jgi:hypothetical protein